MAENPKLEIEYIPVPQLPDYLTNEVNEAIRLYSVSMVVSDKEESRGLPCAGVFVTIDGQPGILTARHVWTEMHKREKLILMVGGRPIRIRTSLLTAYHPQSRPILEPFDAQVPDIAFVTLSSNNKGSIEAYGKVFYSVDRRASDSTFDLHGDDGFWIAIGSPQALLRRDIGAVGSLTYITGIEKRIEFEGWDYLFVNLDIDSNDKIPADLVGMSGGGIWRAKFKVNADRTRYWIEDCGRDIILTGLTFLQTPLEGRQLIAHGPMSIYHVFREFVLANRHK